MAGAQQTSERAAQGDEAGKVTPPYTPEQTVEIPVSVPVVRRRLEVAEVTWSFDAAGWIFIKVNGDAMIGLRPDRARALADAILARAPADAPTDPPVSEV